MNRGEFINHLIEQECYPDEECDSDVSQLWHNAINGHSCYVPYADELTVNSWCHVVYELRIDPPLQHDAFYHVYVGWREGAYNDLLKEDARKDDQN
jgi:hypothetical protein